MNKQADQLHTIVGCVVSNKMNKTVAILVERVVKHPVYGKYIRRSTKLLAHDENNQCQEGDVVLIASCRPFSKKKAFRVVEVVENTKNLK